MADEVKFIDSPEGKFEMSIRVLGNELVALKMTVDDFKMKWIVVGLVAMIAILWAGSAFGPVLMETFGPGN